MPPTVGFIIQKGVSRKVSRFRGEVHFIFFLYLCIQILPVPGGSFHDLQKFRPFLHIHRQAEAPNQLIVAFLAQIQMVHLPILL